MATNPPHLLIFPYPAQGHLLPLLDLSAHLATHFSFSITVIITPKNLPLIQPFISSTSKIQPLILPLPPSSSLPPSAEHVRTLPANISSSALIRGLSSLRPAILKWAKSQSNPANALISDFFLGWCKDLALELRIPHLSFFSSNALLTAILHSLFLSVPISPPLPSFPYPHLPSMFRRYVPGDPDWEFTKKSFLSNSLSSAAIFNTFEFLDSPYLSHLLSSSYAAGNLFAIGKIPSFVTGSIDSKTLSFLNSCEDNSVVYICFGSQFTTPAEVNAVIKSGLEISGVRFVWAVGDEFNEEFEGGNGVVVKGWVEQRAVLEHKAVGAFMTHCGWNSVMEGMMAGVMLLMWPMEADQFVNARLLEEAGMAVKVCECGVEKLPEKEELGRMIGEAVDEGSWPEVRSKVKEMERMAKEAVKEGGESFRDMEEMVKFIQRGC